MCQLSVQNDYKLPDVSKMKTPPRVDIADIAATLSPHVKSARGKGRNSNVQKSCERPVKQSPHFFRMQLDREILRLHGMCDVWRNYEAENDLNEDSIDMINLAIGQTQLLINKKFQQFRGLIDQCENQAVRKGEGPVTVQDLQGFWDMIYMQVENLDIRFNNLNACKERDWKEEYNSPRIVKSKPKIKKKTLAGTRNSQALKAMIRAARQKCQKVANNSNDPEADDNVVQFNGGFYAVLSPSKNRSSVTPVSARKSSLRRSVLISNPMNRKSIEDEKPILIDLKRTPGRSILKTPIGKNPLETSSKKNVKILFANEKSPNVIKSPDTSITEEVVVDMDIDNTPSKISKKRSSKKKLSKQSAISSAENISFKIINQSDKDNTSSREKKLVLTQINTNIEPTSRNSVITSNSSSEKRKSQSASLNGIRKSKARLSYNLINFNSPNPRVYVTRSTFRSPMNLENDLLQ